MHEAYEVSQLLTATVQIETMAAYDNGTDIYLLLGTRQGYLMMYSVGMSNGNQKYEVQLLKYCKTFSKKPVQQIYVIPEDDILLCLTDNVLSTHDIKSSNFQEIKSYPKTKGATLFAVDIKPGTVLTGEGYSLVRICVVVKRKLQIYMGKNGDFKQHMTEFTLTEIPKYISLGVDSIFVAFKSDYAFYDITSGKCKELFPSSSSRSVEPTMEKYSDNQFLLGRDDTTVLVDESGKIQLNVKWKTPPIGLIWDEPFLLGLMQDHIVVQTLKPSIFIQDMSDLNKARIMYRCRRGLIFVASIGQVWCVSAVDVSRQRHMLLNDKQFSLAVQLTALSDLPEDEKKKKIESIRMLETLELFDSKRYSDSMKQFIELEIEPSQVIKLVLTPEGKRNEEIDEKDAESAMQALMVYLTEIRLRIHGGKKDHPVNMESWQEQNITKILELIDTTLLRCYLETKNDVYLASLLRLNNCSLEAAEKALLDFGKYSELIILYQTKGQHMKALQLLKDHAHQQDSSLKGYHRTKVYLQHLGAEHINLVFKFSDWLLRENPEEGIKVFTEDIPEVELLPRAKILDFLLREHDSLAIHYLEHVIHAWNDTNPSFHNALILKYKERILEPANGNKSTQQEIDYIKKKLLKFLESSTHYTPELVLVNFPHDSLLQERALVLGKLGQHDQALAILVLLLGDIPNAIKYCDNVTTKGDAKANSVYISLMKVLLKPQEARSMCGQLAGTPKGLGMPDVETALEILHTHSDVIDPLEALSVLPDTVPISRLKKFLCGSLDKLMTDKRRAQILKGLLYSQQQQAQTLRSYYESQSVVINEYNLCPVCKKRFGNQSAFVRYPNGNIVHFSCAQDAK